MLDVRGQQCLVVGGGGVALRKVEGLLGDGAVVTAVAPEPMEALRQLATDDRLTLEVRPYQNGEASGYSLVFAATDDRGVNRQVSEDAKAAGIWVNVADDPELCTFQLPARMQRGPLQLTVASAGEAPFVVRRLRQVLERRFGPEWAEWIEAAARFRDSVRQLKLSGTELEARFDAFFKATVDPETLTARLLSAEQERVLLQHGPGPEGTVAASDDPTTERPSTAAVGGSVGWVSLVGAGPGDPRLLTLRGYQRLMSADAVVCDRLAATVLPGELPPQVELHWVGKQAGRHPVPQDQINALLVRLARQGKRVVRFKGGDPFVFGRGGEDALALREAGIDFEVVPAVSAGIAVPAYAGIPVTHRGEVVRVTMVTAHEAVKSGGHQVRWDLLAADPHGTFIGYMGVTSLPKVVERMLAAGMAPATPAAMIERGTTAGQRTVRCCLSELPEKVSQACLQPPGLFIIGPTVRHAEQLSWFTERPLFGQRLVLVGQGDELGERLELAGADLVFVTLPVTPAARVVMSAIPLTGCVLRSADEVDALDEERDGAGWGSDVQAWCLTAATADRARALGWPQVQQLAETDLVAAMSSRGRVLD